jgi:hypothetical protein
LEEKKKTFQISENDEDLDELEEIDEEKEKEKVTSNYRFFYVKKLIFTFYFVKSSDHKFSENEGRSRRYSLEDTSFSEKFTEETKMVK